MGDQDLEKETAMLDGLSSITKGYSGDGTASERASNALNSLSEKDIKLGKKSQVIQQIGTGGKKTLREHMEHERDLKKQIEAAQERETSIKSDIAEHTGQTEQFEKSQEKIKAEETQEANEKEVRRKATAKQDEGAAAADHAAQMQH